MSQAPENPQISATVAPSLIRNPLSLIGIALAAVAAINILVLIIIDLSATNRSPYVGILAYMVAPGFLVLGLLLIPLGIALERRRRLRDAGAPFRFARFDPNDPAHRSSAAFVLSFVVAFCLVGAFGSYKAYEFTDSVEFCGELCHTVMHPEFIAYQASPHARVGCVECHVGSGASWYVKSKLSGLRQVYYTARGTFPRPIPTPVHNLRPAPDTCEQCHWPNKFWGAQLKVFTHYGDDEQNTPRVIRLLIKTGGGDPALGQARGGIHWHMNVATKITYFATDEQRQTIPWVRVEDPQGHITEYVSRDSPPTPDQVEKANKRRMDCIDCHNRPTHIYVPPGLSVDRSIAAHKIDASLPYIRQQGVQVLMAEYKTTDEAQSAIKNSIDEFYSQKYSGLASSQAIRDAVGELQRIYGATIFPEMKVNWTTHPNNIGHLYSRGCFRCHDGNHVNKDGKVISKDCNLCHIVLDQEDGLSHVAQVQPQLFKHPVDVGDLAALNCSDCHSSPQ